jgi:hypothetical protein
VNHKAIRRELYEKSPGPGKCVSRKQRYLNNSLERIETRTVTGESDYANEIYIRTSKDNGNSWGVWEDAFSKTYMQKDGMEMIWHRPETGVYNTIHGHYLNLSLQRIFLGDHHDCYKRFWGNGEATWTDHTFFHISSDLKSWTEQLVTYEPGEQFSEHEWTREGYTHVNEAYAGSNLEILPDGDIIFPMGGNVVACCRILGVEVNDIFPSCPHLMRGLIVVRGRWNGKGYDLEPAKPVVISDLKSSRGCDEPVVYPLPGGRIIVVFRGSNVISEGFQTRIAKGTPAHKWFCCSDDGGKTFTEPVQWSFDDGEAFHSPASISYFLKSRKNNKIYWFGNITGPDTYGNRPRYPLTFAQVDENSGLLLRDTFQIVDDRDSASESADVQLSNFALLDDKETGIIELYVTKLGADREDEWRSDAYRYLIEV